jgi:hypothetical protein
VLTSETTKRKSSNIFSLLVDSAIASLFADRALLHYTFLQAWTALYNHKLLGLIFGRQRGCIHRMELFKKGNDGIMIRTGDRLSNYMKRSLHKMNGKPDSNWKLVSSTGNWTVP